MIDLLISYEPSVILVNDLDETKNYFINKATFQVIAYLYEDVYNFLIKKMMHLDTFNKKKSFNFLNYILHRLLILKR